MSAGLSGLADSVQVVPSQLHEMLVEMFRHRPGLIAELLTNLLGMPLPAHETARLEPAECVDLTPAEYRADAVVVLTSAESPVLAVVVEIQLNRDRNKTWSWPLYVATLRARLRCPTLLLVICVDMALASWAATPIELGNPGSRLVPIVLGPQLIPVTTDPGTIPETVVLSAIAHGGHPQHHEVLTALVKALASVETEHAVLYAELVFAALPHAARKHLEALMSTQTHSYISEYAKKFIAQGEAQGEARGQARGEARGQARGEARSVLAVLDARGINVPEDTRNRITSCTDLDQLHTWVRRAATATSIDDLFS